MTATLQFDDEDFGKYVDYRLLAVNSESSFTQLVSTIAECCHCNFSSSDDYIPLPPLTDIDAHFKTAFSQFNCQGRSEQFAYSSVDKLNVFIISNKTQRFDRRKAATVLQSKELLLFPTEYDTCYVLNNKGLFIKKWTYPNIDFFVMIFSKKQHGVDDFVEFLLQNTQLNMENMTEYLFGKKKNKAGEWVQTKQLSTSAKFLRKLLHFAEHKINNHSENNITNYIGKSTPQSNNIFIINNLRVINQ